MYQASEAAIHGTSRAAALEILEDIAENKPAELTLDAARRAGLLAYFAPQLSFANPNVSLREYAFGMLGRTGLPEAIAFLSTMTPEKLSPDDSERLYPMSQLALRQALFQQETDSRSQIAFLEREVTSPANGYSALWAREELCDRGSIASIEMIQESIKSLYSGSRGDEMVAFCQARMDVVKSDPDRAKAVGSVLQLGGPHRDEQILRWAIYTLFALESEEADGILNRYATDVERNSRVTASASENPMHRGLAQEIRRHGLPHLRK